MNLPTHTRGGQRTTLGNLFSSATVGCRGVTWAFGPTHQMLLSLERSCWPEDAFGFLVGWLLCFSFFFGF